MKVAILTTDSREHRRIYTEAVPGFGTAPQGLITGFQSLEGSRQALEIHVISCAQQPMESPAKLAENIFFHSLHVPKAGWLKTGYLGCIVAVRNLLRKIEPDLVHAQGTERDCAISGAFFTGPKVLTIHGNLRLIRKTIGFPPFSAMWIQSYLEGIVVPRYDGVVSISSYTDNAIKGEVPRTWIVPNAVDPTFFRLPAVETSPPTSRPTILVVANIDKRKNQNEFIRIAKELRAELDFEVRFFGALHPGDYSTEFLSLVQTHQGWCSYGGMLTRSALLEEFKRASILALPTLEDNCPMVVLEAQAAGLPVVASAVGGIPDLITHDTTGLLVPAGDGRQMKTALRRLITDAGLRYALAQAGHQKALTTYHPKIVAEQHVRIYQEVLDRHRFQN